MSSSVLLLRRVLLARFEVKPVSCLCHRSGVRYRSTKSRSRSGARKLLAELTKQSKSRKYDGSSIKFETRDDPLPQTHANFLNADMDMRQMIDDASERIHARFIEPNIYWKNSMNLESLSKYNIKEELSSKAGEPRAFFKPIDVFDSPLDVGDLVELGNSLESSQLYCVVELPVSVDDPRYTLVSNYGELTFVSKSHMKLRFPRIYPKSWFQDFVLDEKLFSYTEKGIKKIGKPKFLTEDSPINNISKSFFEQALINKGHNLNQLDTFITPSLPSELIASDLTKIISKAWEELPTLSSKLELLHNLFQDSESPVSLNIFQLYHAVELLDLNKTERSMENLQTFDDAISYYGRLSEKISKLSHLPINYSVTSLGKPIVAEIDMFRNCDLASFYAMMLALKKNEKLFTGVLNVDFATQFPLSVTLQPLSRIVEADVAVEDSKENAGRLNRLVNYMVKRMDLVAKGKCNESENELTKPEEYDTVVHLMKAYCSTSTKFDPVTETFLIKIFRNMPRYKDMTITSPLIYDTLIQLDECHKLQNPIDWSLDLLKPFTGISERATMEQEFYDALEDINVVQQSTDCSAGFRQDFDDVIYCIDDKSAHEIDDGIAVEKLSNGLIKIKTFIADPASYLSPDDTVSKIAFQRTSTMYFPDMQTKPMEMLPTSVVSAVELRTRAKDTKARALAFSFLYDPDQKSYIPHSMEIVPAQVQNLVNITYDTVDDVLRGDTDSLHSIATKNEIKMDKIRDDLELLFNVSQNLSSQRAGKTSFNFKFAGQLTGVTGDQDGGLSLRFEEDSFSNSQVLVSEIMIHTNALVAQFMKEKHIPTIYRTLKKIPLSDTVQNQIDSLDRTQLKDTQKAANFMTGTSYSINPVAHDYIGLGPYVTVTSPLRRFQDLMCHWQLHSFLKLKNQSDPEAASSFKGKLAFSENNISYAMMQIASRSAKLRQAARKSRNFYIFRKLTEVAEKAKFEVMIRSRPTTSGEVEGILLGYGGVRCLLKSGHVFSNQKSTKEIESTTHQNLSYFSRVRIGDIVQDCYIEDINLLTGDLNMKSENF